MGSEAPRTLLVLKPSSFGDIIHTLPAVARLKAAWPDCRISWLVNPEWMPLLEGNPAVAEIIPFPRGEFRGWGGGLRLARWLRSEIVGRRFDLALDFQGLLRTAVIGRVSGARKIVGLSDAREGASWFYHRTVISPRQPVHAAVRYMALADAVIDGQEEALQKGLDIIDGFPLPPGKPVDLPADFRDGFILIHPFARGTNKSLSLNEIQDFTRELNSSKIIIVGRSESPVDGLERGSLNLLNQTSIAELIWLIRRAAFVISVDSGPAHLAAALKRPMVSIHSWSDPRRVGPCRPDAWVWKNGRLAQMRDLAVMGQDFFEPRSLYLRAEDVAAIAALAISPSNSCA